MNEWGIPDWRDPQAYGDTSKWSLMRWRWEFYRRRDDLREVFDANAERTYRLRSSEQQRGFAVAKDHCKDGRLLRPDEPGFVTSPLDTGEPFGYWGVPNPRISNQPEDVILAPALPHCPPAFHLGRVATLQGEDALREPVYPGQAAVVFDLSKPIVDQFKAIRALLERHQEREFGKVKRHRLQKSKWLGYLRALDAGSAGASWAKIASIFDNTARTPQTGRDKWQQADALRNNFELCFTIPRKS